MSRAGEAPVKISVVVPTYAPGDRINRLVRSLDEQTMPHSEFEVIFVDDGSPDDTWERLQRIRDWHDNVRIEHISNSGWPSRPRNVGLELARGDYVLFMDHDDELYPRALEAGYAMAQRTGADVLNGKETRTDQSKWALEVYQDTIDNAIERTDVHPLIPTNPHKLFRRALLMEHDVRFPEGRRVLWEDVFFCLDLAPHARVISVMADPPFYHWVRGETTASSSYADDRKEYWRWVREIIVRTNERLRTPALMTQWRLMLAHQYRSRVLSQLGAGLLKAPPDELAHVRAIVDEIVHDLVPVEIDAELTPTQLGRAALIRAGRWDLLGRLAGIDKGPVGLSSTTRVHWADGALQLAVESRWRCSGDTRLALRRCGERIVRDLPADLAAALPDAAIDVTEALAGARTGLGIRSRRTGVTWMLPGECEPTVDTVDGTPELRVVARATLDPNDVIFGRPLDERSWDLTARNELFGAINQRGLRTATQARCAVRGGHVYVAYRNKSGMLSLDVDEENRSLAGSAPLAPERLVLVTEPDPAQSRWPRRRTVAASFELPFGAVTTSDDSVVDGSVSVGPRSQRPARIEARPDGAWLVSSFADRPGRYPMTLHFHGRDMDSGVEVVARSNGTVAFTRRP